MTPGPVAVSEDAFKDQVIELARMLGYTRIAHFRPARTAHGWRTPMQGDKGFPDLVLVGRGRVIFAELKTAKGVVSDDQREWIEAIAATPVEVYLWRPADLDEIAEILRRRPAV